MAKKETTQMEMKTLYVPVELITEILRRLPVKCVIRFKSVCKSWFSLISQPNFANSHFQFAVPAHTRRILAILPTIPPKLHSIDFEINHHSVSLNHKFLLPRRNFNFVIKGSCRGFICLYCCRDIWIWNPSNGFHKQIPLSPSGSKLDNYKLGHLYGFGYDPSRDDYVVVLLSYDPRPNLSSHLEFFSFRDNRWNEIGDTCATYLNATCYPEAGSFINGTVHWLAKRYHSSMVVIVGFDLMERKLFEMPLPDDFHNFRENYGMWVFGESLSLWVNRYCNHTIEIWVMKDYKLHSSWTKTLVIRYNYGIPFILIYRTKCGDIIAKDGDRLVKYNDKGQLIEYLQIDQHSNKLAMYTESLCSLPLNCEQV